MKWNSGVFNESNYYKFKKDWSFGYIPPVLRSHDWVIISCHRIFLVYCNSLAHHSCNSLHPCDIFSICRNQILERFIMSTYKASKSPLASTWKIGNSSFLVCFSIFTTNFTIWVFNYSILDTECEFYIVWIF